MQRSARLERLQARLGRSADPMTRVQLCDEFEMTPRMLARDVATLIAEGIPVIGDARRSYLLHPAHAAPLLRFSVEERRALTLGLQGFIGPSDPVQENARRTAQAKLLAAMTMEDRTQSLYLTLWQADDVNPITHEKVVLLRRAMRDQVVVSFHYLDLQNVDTSRRVKPVALTWRGANLLFAGWCETRRDFRHFVLDRMARLTVTTQRYQPEHAVLLVQWQAHDGQI